jgi:hypothetical protein
MIDIQTERLKILGDAKEYRIREIMQHQINIDNYRISIEVIKKDYPEDSAMLEFAERLQELLASSIVEQRKENILLAAITSQLPAE